MGYALSSICNVLRLFFFVLMLAPAAMGFGEDWRPVDPTELSSNTPVVEKDADAEAIFWEVRVEDELDNGSFRTVLHHYIRIKIYTERGRESQSKIDIPYLGNIKISDISARTVKPNGSIIDLNKKDVYERTIVSIGGVKVMAKSFAMPGVEPGAIIEYRWREQRGDTLTFYDRLQLQRDIPVRVVKYYIKPVSFRGFNFVMRIETFHRDGATFVKEKDGFYSTTHTNIPAFREEPKMPPLDAVRPWMLVYYARPNVPTSPQTFWAFEGVSTYQKYREDMEVSDEVKTLSAATIADASTPEQKLLRLFEFCRTKIKNVNDDASEMSTEERANWKPNTSSAETIKRGMGTIRDIDLLFMSLAIAAGFDARVARLSDRSDIFFDESFPNAYFMTTYAIAVHVGDTWRFFDPGSTYVPFGMLLWQEEGQVALVSDPTSPFWVKTPLSPPEKSEVRGTANLRLLQDGTLEGDVRIEYTGHFAVYYKEYNDDDSQTEREETLREAIKARMRAAEVTNIRIDGVRDPVKPFAYDYHVKIPGYAQRTGKRLIVRPAFFQYGIEPLFNVSTRKYSIYFIYPWSESDTVNIDLPEGFETENADAPAPMTSGNLTGYSVKINIKDMKTITFNRKFFFGAGGTGLERLLYPTSTYPALKQYFDMLHARDSQVITLKEKATSAANQN